MYSGFGDLPETRGDHGEGIAFDPRTGKYYASLRTEGRSELESRMSNDRGAYDTIEAAATALKLLR